MYFFYKKKTEKYEFILIFISFSMIPKDKILHRCFRDLQLRWGILLKVARFVMCAINLTFLFFSKCAREHCAS